MTRGHGTPYYMAPDVKEDYYNYKVDVFSVGCILFEIITAKQLKDAFKLIEEVGLLELVDNKLYKEKRDKTAIAKNISDEKWASFISKLVDDIENRQSIEDIEKDGVYQELIKEFGPIYKKLSENISSMRLKEKTEDEKLLPKSNENYKPNLMEDNKLLLIEQLLAEINMSHQIPMFVHNKFKKGFIDGFYEEITDNPDVYEYVKSQL